MSLIRSYGTKIAVPSSSALTLEQIISNLNCLPTHDIFDAILDDVSLEKSKGPGDDYHVPNIKSQRRRFTCHALRTCSHGGGGPQESEVPHPPEVRKTWRSHATPGCWGVV